MRGVRTMVYEKSDDILKELDDEFLSIFLGEMKLKFKDIPIIDYDLVMSTQGWIECLTKTCEKTNKIHIMDIYNSIPVIESEDVDLYIYGRMI